MGLLNPAPGVVDLDDWRALKPFYEAASAAGLWVVLRPGEYKVYALTVPSDLVRSG